MMPYSVNGCSNYLLRREFGKPFCAINILAKKWCPKHFGPKGLAFFVWPDGGKKTSLSCWVFREKGWLRECFSEDKLLGTATLREQYPALYRIVRGKTDTLAQVLSSSPTDVSLQKDLVGPHLTSWQHMLSHLDSVNLTSGRDVFH